MNGLKFAKSIQSASLYREDLVRECFQHEVTEYPSSLANGCKICPCLMHNGDIFINGFYPEPFRSDKYGYTNSPSQIWDYKTAKIDQIRSDLLKIYWHDLFLNLNVSEKALPLQMSFWI